MRKKISRIDIVGQNGNDAEIYHHLHKHGHRPRSGQSPTYQSWLSMKARCENPLNHNFSLYGGRGIVVCDRWMEFVNFLSDMGERRSGTTIDRINPDGNYEPINCRWATSKEQAINRRTTRLILFRGKSVLLTDLAKQFGISITTIYRRYHNGITDDGLIAETNKQRSIRMTPEIVRLRNLGSTVVDIALSTGVSTTTVKSILSNDCI